MTDGTAPMLAVQSLAYAGLDTLLLALPLDLCAYLHVGEELGPQLYLRRPTLAELDPAEAFQLFSSLRDLLDDTSAEAPSSVALQQFTASVARSTGPRSQGLWVVGVRDGSLEDAQTSVASALGAEVMAVCHAAEVLNAGGAAAPGVPASISRVAVETVATGLRAEVSVVVDGREASGRGEELSALAAVASATLDAVGSPSKLVAAGEDGLGEARVVLVLTMGEDGHTSVGASVVDGEPLRAAATATLRALAAV